jgi:hypothetical protein
MIKIAPESSTTMKPHIPTYCITHKNNTSSSSGSSSNPLRSSMKNHNKRSSNNNKQPISSCSVKFIQKCQMKYTISIDDMTNDEICNMWIQQDEESYTRQRCQKIVALVEKNDRSSVIENRTKKKEKQLCIRGLETYTKIGGRLKKMNRIVASEKVFIEQAKQWDHGYYNEEEIALVYNSVSNECQQRAGMKAIEDRIAVEKYLKIF